MVIQRSSSVDTLLARRIAVMDLSHNAGAERLGVNEHLSKQFDADLDSIRSRVLEMGGLVEAQIRRAVDALTTANLALTQEVIAADHRVNAMEVQLDSDCSQLIVRRQPAAGDLRMIFAIMKTVTDLERIGDEAQKIARMAKNIHERGGTQAVSYTHLTLPTSDLV